MLEARQDYAVFATYDAGIILPEQISPDLMGSFAFIDTRSAEEFAEETIPGALDVEWRDEFARLQDIPTDKPTVLFCNAGAL